MTIFRRNAERLGLCDEFSQRWSNCKSKKQLYDLACNVNSLAYLAEMIAKGYGLSSEYLQREFGQFLNGKCVHVDTEGYTSVIYCGLDGGMDISTTCALIVDCRGVVSVGRAISEIYIVNSEVRIEAEDGCEANVYLYNSQAEHGGTVSVKENKKF